MSKVSVVLPSYNESQNIISIVNTILDLKKYGIDTFLYVVDDNSPDGTPKILQNELKSNTEWQERVYIFIRKNKGGRGSAIRYGFINAIKSKIDFDYFVEMDCDFSHPPIGILKGISLLESGNDVVLGSRYPDGIIEGWPLKRKLFSFFSNQLARILLSRVVHDYTNGFRFYKRKMVKLLIQYEQRNNGYIYLSETLSLFLFHKVKISEFPIHFINRERGHSNTGIREILSSLKGIIGIGIRYRFGRL